MTRKAEKHHDFGPHSKIVWEVSSHKELDEVIFQSKLFNHYFILKYRNPPKTPKEKPDA